VTLDDVALMQLVTLKGPDGATPLYDDAEHAQTEAKGVAENRLQNLAITLNKVAYVIKEWEDPATKMPLRGLTEAEVRVPIHPS